MRKKSIGLIMCFSCCVHTKKCMSQAVIFEWASSSYEACTTACTWAALNFDYHNQVDRCNVQAMILFIFARAHVQWLHFFFVILSIKQKITTQKADNARTFKTDYQIHVYIHFRCVIIFCALSNNFELIYSNGLTNSLYSPFFASIFIHYILKMQINGKFISKIWIS